MSKIIQTYKYRIKDSTHTRILSRMANSVNYVWNYCNQISSESGKRRKFSVGKNTEWQRKIISNGETEVVGNYCTGENLRWVTEFDLNYLLAGTSKELGLNANTILSISAEFIARRNQFKRSKLRWRSNKKNLGWIPFRGNAVQIKDDSFKYLGRKFKFWKSREMQGKYKSGSFNQDSEGRWYVNFACEIESINNVSKSKKISKTKKKTPKNIVGNAIGIDLGLKTLATCSDGTKIENPKVLSKYAEQLAMAQRANKKRRVKKIYAKIKNVRKDFLHKTTSKLVKEYKQIFVGDVNSTKLAKTNMAKSVLDAGWGAFKTMLEYKAIRLGIEFNVTNEKYSTVTCSNCLERSGPSGLGALEVREWVCSNCNCHHDRDVNAAKNILIFALGHKSPLGETE